MLGFRDALHCTAADDRPIYPSTYNDSIHIAIQTHPECSSPVPHYATRGSSLVGSAHVAAVVAKVKTYAAAYLVCSML